MDEHKREKLTAAGWRVGTAEEFLDLTPEQAAQVEAQLRAAERRVQEHNERNEAQRAANAKQD